VAIEVLVLRRIYPRAELFQLLATFAVLLVIKDAAAVRLGAGRPGGATCTRLERRYRDPRASACRSMTWC